MNCARSDLCGGRSAMGVPTAILGHANISDTYWYLTGTPELMESVGARFERFVRQGAGHE